MATMEEIVKQADLLGHRGEKREEYLKQEFKLLAERQEKKEEAERQERKEKEEAECQAREKKEEAERQEKKEEAERQERKEEADFKERLELEKMKLGAEMKMLQAKIEAGIIKNEPDGSDARSNDAGAKHPKLPNFQDGRDDLDIWLTRSCFKCKKTGHIARYCTAVDSTTKKASAGVVVKTFEVNTAEVRKHAESPTMDVTDDLQSEVEGGMLKLVSGKSVPVMTNCAALRDPEKTRSLGLPVLKER
ncbi:reticulocyte-binding protein 2 homolog a [Plakobranchus ocellatus]|uniref:Reticulocyte-binding protein 2 homolog a n=1 Tax=Plakobranchus ocellatus TaxID=259542 RepID=A0AAV4CR40_9GAST|nr:reticulocyte-binding protein 2 homolog a [Plakobranchus ocellatus]